jgi:hypothetical protein
MTAAVARYFQIRDACAAAGGVLTEMARAMDDAIVSGVALEKAAGCHGRWRVEARQVMRQRLPAGNPASGNCSDDARQLRKSLLRYARVEYERDKLGGIVPAGPNAALFLILSDAGGRVPSVRTLRRPKKLAKLDAVFGQVISASSGHDAEKTTTANTAPGPLIQRGLRRASDR